MSFPVQIVVAGRDLRPAIQDVASRLGTSRGHQVAWVLDDPGLPDFAARLVRQRREMLSIQSHEGGFALVIVADSGRSLMDALIRVSEVAEPKPRISLAVTLADEGASCAGALDFLDAVHLVPSRLPSGMVLGVRERIRMVANITGVFLEFARREAALEQADLWVRRLRGAQFSVARAARFQAPSVMEVLARDLASRVAESMVRRVDAGAKGVIAEPEGPSHDEVLDDLVREAERRGRGMADMVLGGDEGIPAREELAERAADQCREMPKVVREVLARGRGQSMDQAAAWVAGLQRFSDEQLRARGLAGVGPLMAALEKTHAAIRRGLGSGGPVRDAGVALADEEVTPPDPAELIEVAAAWEGDQADHERGGMLLAAWSLLLALVAGLACQPLVARLAGGGAAEDAAPWKVTLLSVALGGVVLLVAAAYAFVRRQQESAQSSGLRQALEEVREGYRTAWADLVAGQVRRVGELVRKRVLSLALDAVDREVARLRSIRETVVHLRDSYALKEGRAGAVRAEEYDSDITLPEEFFDLALQGTEPDELVQRFDGQVQDPDWRSQLSFMRREAMIEACRERFRDFQEQIPFDRRDDIRAVLVNPTRLALSDMARRLSRLVPHSFGAERLFVVPERLLDAVPADDAVTWQPYRGTSDLFAMVSWPAGGR